MNGEQAGSAAVTPVLTPDGLKEMGVKLSTFNFV
jgi:hypothetical protein